MKEVEQIEARIKKRYNRLKLLNYLFLIMLVLMVAVMLILITPLFMRVISDAGFADAKWVCENRVSVK